MIELIHRAATWPDRTAVVETETGRRVSYGELDERSSAVAEGLLRSVPGGPVDDLAGRRVCALLSPGIDYVVAQWATWRAGGVWVPMAVSHPPRELAFVLSDADPSIVLVASSMAGRIEEATDVLREEGPGLDGSARTVAEVEALAGAGRRGLPDVDDDRPALMIYTSGTTGRPKGVITTHGNVNAQIAALTEAWGWTGEDHILHILPLHHVHGIVNVLCCALHSGARCTFAPADARVVWQRFGADGLSLIMAVPTIYARLQRAWDEASPAEQEEWSRGARGLRLMVSGSAALPVTTLERWREITGQTLLERYGMTEIGMGLTNPLDGERRPGTVGQPFPSVEIKLVDDMGQTVAPGQPGQIHIRGPQVFSEYWRRPEATVEAFDDGWFITGDEAILEDGYYRILGRRSVDIIKTGGYKVSALEIEAALREHAQIRDVAVVGVEDPEWGERVCVALELVDSGELTLDELRAWGKERLAPYKVPSRLRHVDALPRNAMGKVTKPAVKALFANE